MLTSQMKFTDPLFLLNLLYNFLVAVMLRSKPDWMVYGYTLVPQAFLFLLPEEIALSRLSADHACSFGLEVKMHASDNDSENGILPLLAQLEDVGNTCYSVLN